MMRVRIRGAIYDSVADASTALGVSTFTIYSACINDTTDGVGLRGRLPITIRGVTYSCARKAAMALGVSYGRIRNAKCRGTLETVGTRAKKCS